MCLELEDSHRSLKLLAAMSIEIKKLKMNEHANEQYLYPLKLDLERIENQKFCFFSIPQVGPLDAHKNKHIY